MRRAARAAATSATRGARFVGHSSHRSRIEVPDLTFTQFLLDRQQELGDKEAMCDVTTGESMSHGQIYDRTLRVATSLHAMGFKKGDIALTNLANKLEYPVMMLAVQLLGGTLSSCSPQFSSAEIASQANNCSARWMFTDDFSLGDIHLSQRMLQAAKDCGVPPEHVVIVGQDSWSRLLESNPSPPAVEMSPDDMCLMPYSSGTTGPPKGVMLSHRNLVANCLQVEELQPRTEDVYFAVLPFFHIYPHVIHLNYGLHVGTKSCLMPRFELAAYLKGLQDHKVTFVHIAPPIAVLLANSPIVDEYDLSALKVVCSAAAPLGPELEAALVKRLGVTVMQAWGMSELSPIGTFMPTADRGRDDLRGSVGCVVANTDWRCVSPATGEEVPPGSDSVGELRIRGPQVMLGYFNRPDATKSTIDEEGFLRTGDIARVNADGFVWIVDRLKEIIKYKGHQVAPSELEEVLLTHDEVADCCVIRSENSAGEEIPKACVVLSPGSKLTEDALMAFVAERVAPFKKVRAVDFMDSIPKTASGKLLRRVLVQRDQEMRKAASSA
eukprot:TRINITY_DN35420_c0_g1_i1.p1 TRINITY_DN35420_c0_g1~~TRINITY_DN35420_c0_g1_i1.p1  ORF type:complete len:571 (+),score=164.06 TRINITY_DN35420_c0_g1_i1:55-1713(+)